MSDRYGQATSTKLQRDLSRLERDRVEASDDALRWVLSQPAGRRFWNDLILGHLDFNKVCGDVSAQSHRFEGRRIAASNLLERAQRICPEQLCQAELEAVQAKRLELVTRGALRTKPSGDDAGEKDDTDA